MNRIEQKFQELRQQGRKALLAYVTAGDPSLAATRDLVLTLEKNGADIVELGVPFSDPLADGPTIQAASYRALKQGTTLAKILDTVKEIRRVSQVPVALMTYYNPVLHFGESRFVEAAKAAGVDGIMVPDLPPEESGPLIAAARVVDLSTVFFVSPTTASSRLPEIIEASTGFIYYVSVAGVTGARADLPEDFSEQVARIKRRTDKPVCVGFGVSTPEQVQALAKISDGVIVGSAIVRQVEHWGEDLGLLEKVGEFVKSLSAGLGESQG